MQKSLLIDPAKCTSCLQCEMACSFEHEGVFNPAKSRIKIFEFEHGRTSIPYTCTQCAEAWCLHACPVEAITINMVTGAKEVADDVCVGILRKLEKQRRESIEAYEKGGREERAAEERAELEVLQTFLPSLADEATTRGWVEAAIAASGASKPGDVGRVMGMVMKEHKGDVDGGLAKRLAAELLADG